MRGAIPRAAGSSHRGAGSPLQASRGAAPDATGARRRVAPGGEDQAGDAGGRVADHRVRRVHPGDVRAGVQLPGGAAPEDRHCRQEG